MTTEDLTQMIGDMLTLKEFREFISTKFPDSLDEKYIKPAVEEFQKIGTKIADWENNFEKNLDSTMLGFLEKLEITKKEKITATNLR